MPRRARLRLAGLPLHVIQRGNNRSECFFAEVDYTIYLQQLDELCHKFECAIHAYVLMTNHVHLLVTPACRDGVSLMMKHLGQRYVQYVNRRYGRSGTMWEGRFRSSVVQDTGYLLRCQRYIELNPVRAGMVSHPRQYQWSSYRSNAERARSEFVTPHAVYVSLATNVEERVAAYRSLFDSVLNSEDVAAIRSAVNGGFAWGSAGFKDAIAAMLGRRVDRGAPGRPRTVKDF